MVLSANELPFQSNFLNPPFHTDSYPCIRTGGPVDCIGGSVGLFVEHWPAFWSVVLSLLAEIFSDFLRYVKMELAISGPLVGIIPNSFALSEFAGDHFVEVLVEHTWDFGIPLFRKHLALQYQELLIERLLRCGFPIKRLRMLNNGVRHVTIPGNHNIEDISICRELNFLIHECVLNKNIGPEIMVFLTFSIIAENGPQATPTPRPISPGSLTRT